MDESGAGRFDEIDGWPLPEAQTRWLGAPSAEETLREAFLGGKMHHAWLIGGPKGIGKATLAYRFARFALAHPDPASAAKTRGLELPADEPVFRKVAGRGHPNLLTLQRPWDEKTKRFRTELTVDEVRRLIPFFGSTAGEAGWRIAIVDAADDMNRNAANALLKLLEEPPAQSLLLVLSHAPGRLLPTIRSRTRSLPLSPLPATTIAEALAVSGREGDDGAGRMLAAELSGGSLRRAILLMENGGIELYRELLRLTADLPDIDVPSLHAFADRIVRRGEDDLYATVLDLLRDWLNRRVRREPEPEAGLGLSPAITAVPLARWAEVWEKAEQVSANAEEYNLDRKQVILTTFMTLARATRM